MQIRWIFILVLSLGMMACAHKPAPKAVAAPADIGGVEYVDLYKKTTHETSDGQTVEVTWY